MLRKIVSIKNVGRFRNSSNKPNPELGRCTLVFAPNGYGKTTFCSVLRSIENSDPGLILGRRKLSSDAEPEISLLFSTGICAFGDSVWTGSAPRLSIFDPVFVAENVHSGDVVDLAHRRAIYRVIVGSAGVSLAERELELAEQSRTKQRDIGGAEKVVDTHAGILARKTFLALQAVEDAAGKITAQEGLVRTLTEADAIDARKPLVEPTTPNLPAQTFPVLARTIETLADNVEELLRTHLQDHRMADRGERWIGEGVDFEMDDTCPFCGRPGLDELPLIQAYRSLFVESYRDLRVAISDTRARVAEVIGATAQQKILTTIASNEGALEFWKAHCSLDPEAFPSVGEALASLNDAHVALDALFAIKVAAPLQPVGTAAERDLIEAAMTAASEALGLYRQAVVAANVEIEAKKLSTVGGDLTKVDLETLKATSRRHDVKVAADCARLLEFERQKAAIETEKKEVRGKLEAHGRGIVGPYEARINHFLKSFNADFQIRNTGHQYPGGVATAVYELEIDDRCIPLGDGKTSLDKPSFKNTLSAGDRATLALAFFFAHLEREAGLSERVVVFDDPFGSQDAFRRKQTMFEIADLVPKTSQVIVLSHDPQFLKLLWDRCSSSERVALQVTYHPARGSVVSEFDLSDACKGRAATELDDLIAFERAGHGKPRDVIKKMRVVLETHYRSSFPGSFGPTDNCSVIIRKISERGESHPAWAHRGEMERIDCYTADYHHGEDARGQAEPALDETELTGYVRMTLRLANALPA
jgi:wobble nucleotide-excising tRNase